MITHIWGPLNTDRVFSPRKELDRDALHARIIIIIIIIVVVVVVI
jgi:hypothetical protein